MTGGNNWLRLNEWLESLKKPHQFHKRYSLEKDSAYYGGSGNRALERDEFSCQRCGNRWYLEVHHIDGKSLFNRVPPKEVNNGLDNLITLCYFCHKAIHRRRPASMIEAIERYFSYFEKGKIKTEHFGIGEFGKHISGTVIEIKCVDNKQRMFSYDDLFFDASFLEQFMSYAMSVYENHCYNCREEISSHSNKKCNDCSWYICDECGSCNCQRTSDETFGK